MLHKYQGFVRASNKPCLGRGAGYPLLTSGRGSSTSTSLLVLDQGPDPWLEDGEGVGQHLQRLAGQVRCQRVEVDGRRSAPGLAETRRSGRATRPGGSASAPPSPRDRSNERRCPARFRSRSPRPDCPRRSRLERSARINFPRSIRNMPDMQHGDWTPAPARALERDHDTPGAVSAHPIDEPGDPHRPPRGRGRQEHQLVVVVVDELGREQDIEGQAHDRPADQGLEGRPAPGRFPPPPDRRDDAHHDKGRSHWTAVVDQEP